MRGVRKNVQDELPVADALQQAGQAFVGLTVQHVDFKNFVLRLGQIQHAAHHGPAFGLLSLAADVAAQAQQQQYQGQHKRRKNENQFFACHSNHQEHAGVPASKSARKGSCKDALVSLSRAR